MGTGPTRPAQRWCRVTLVGPDGGALATLAIDRPTAPDIAAVDELARMALDALRLGYGLALSQVDPNLRELLELAALPVRIEP